MISQAKSEGLGEELIIELTQAQYLQNDSIALTTVEEIDSLLGTFIEKYSLIKSVDTVAAKKKYEKWLLDIASVKIEQLLHNSARDLAVVHVAHKFFQSILSLKSLSTPRILFSPSNTAHCFILPYIKQCLNPTIRMPGLA